VILGDEAAIVEEKKTVGGGSAEGSDEDPAGSARRFQSIVTTGAVPSWVATSNRPRRSRRPVGPI